MNRSEYLLYRPNERRRSVAGLWFSVFAVFAVLYGLTCSRGVAWQDSGIFQLRIFSGDLRGWMGLALAHPLFIALAQPVRWLPHGAQLWGVNFVSGFWAAVALANLACLTAKLTGTRWAGLAVACMLGVSHTFWWLATITETYTMQAALFTVELWLLVRLLDKPSGRRLAALALVSGLGFSVHNLSLLALPVYLAVTGVLLAKRRIGWGAIGLAAVAWLAGASLYLTLIVQQAMATGDVLATIRDALVGSYGADVLNMGTKENPRGNVNMALMAMNLASFLVPLGIVGQWKFPRRLGAPLAWALGAVAVMEITFVLRYPVADQFTFILPGLVMIALAAGVGAVSLAKRSRAWRRVIVLACVLSIALPPVAQFTAAKVLADHPMNATRRPFRQEMRYWLVPWKHNESSADQFARLALFEAGPDGVILTDNTAHPAMVLTVDRTASRVGIHYDHAPDQDRSDLPVCGESPEAFIAALEHRGLWATSPDAVPPALRAVVTLEPDTLDDRMLHEVQIDR